MTKAIDRRSVLKAVAALGLFSTNAAQGFAATAMKLGPAVPFSFDGLKAMAQRMAGEPHVGPARPSPDIVTKINYEAWGKIKFNMDHALFAEGPGRFPVSFFHLGMFFQKAVEMHVVDAGSARQIIYDQSYFEMPKDSIAKKLPQGAGFAGLRVQEARDGALDWHKTIGWLFSAPIIFARSANCASMGSPRGRSRSTSRLREDRKNFRISRNSISTRPKPATPSRSTLCLKALRSWALAALCWRTNRVTMDIDQTLFLRSDITRFGLAPLTSMYWFSETKKETGIDWRPEVHDSDGLALWMGSGERAWRPLNNAPHIITSSFTDDNPRGFGLLQRDRSFDHYQDGVNYDRRPSLWVNPRAPGARAPFNLSKSRPMMKSTTTSSRVGAGESRSCRLRGHAFLSPYLGR